MDISEESLGQRRGGFRLPRAELVRLMIKSDAAGLRRATVHLAAIALVALAVLHSRSSLWQIPFTLLLAYLIAFIFCAEHECAHQTAFKTRILNQMLGHFAAWLLLLPYEYYRAFHWDHHRFTQDPERDPELAVPLPGTAMGVLWLWSALGIWWQRLRRILRHALLGAVHEPWIPENKRALVIAEARLYLSGYVMALAGSLMLGSSVLLWIWILPMIVGQWFLRPYLLSEHTGCSHSPDLLENTRTTYSNRLVHLFAWNMPYHAEHHAYPSVPFHALPALNRLVDPHLKQTASGYVAAWTGVCRYLVRRPS